MTVISPTEFERRMREFDENAEKEHYDYEISHSNADALMCEVLRQLGYEKGVEIFNNMGKWYA